MLLLATSSGFRGKRRGDCKDHALWAWRKLNELGIAAELVCGQSRADEEYFPVLVMTSAQRRGLIVDNEKLRTQIEFTLATFQPNHERIRKGQAIPGGNTMAAYALVTLEASRPCPRRNDLRPR